MAAKAKTDEAGATPDGGVKSAIRPRCGVVMPISPIDGCDERHWADVKDILFDAIEDAGYEPDLVSNANDAGIIQNRIVQNLYDNEIVVVDVSGKNPNCMFELGMRLAFDKPTIIVKDNVTGYSFDTSPIEHLGYPRDLRFGNIVNFKQDLADKIKGTVLAAKDPNYKTFLKHFTNITVAQLDTKEVSKEDFVLEEIASIKELLAKIAAGPAVGRSYTESPDKIETVYLFREIDTIITSLCNAYREAKRQYSPILVDRVYTEVTRRIRPSAINWSPSQLQKYVSERTASIWNLLAEEEAVARQGGTEG